MPKDVLIWALLGASWAAILALIGMAIRQGQRIKRLEIRLNRLLGGSEEPTLASAIEAHLQRLDEVALGMQTLRTEAEDLHKTLTDAIQHIGMVRFNPFADTGGDLSFALALANAKGDGAILCNLHGRRESRLYAKPLKGWQSPYALSEEEMRAVELAQGRHKVAD